VKFLPLVWAGVWRKPGRTILTLLSVMVAFLLYGLLQGFVSGLSTAVGALHADVMISYSRVSQLEPLPVSQAEQIRNVPGVAAVAPLIIFSGTYRKPTAVLRAFAVDPALAAAADPAANLSPALVQALQRDRAGAVVSPEQVRAFGWKVGDRVPIRSLLWTNKDGTGTFPVDIVGTFSGGKGDIFTNTMLVNYDYIDQARSASNGTASIFLLRVTDPKRASDVAARVDRLFANSPHETKTATLREMAQDSLQQIGDIGLVVHAIVGAVFFALLFSVGSVMMQSVRERTPELAVLKTLGFSDPAVLALILGEALVFCLVSAGLGLLLAELTFPVIRQVTGFGIQAGAVLLFGLVLAAALALISGLPPAIRGMRLQIVDALAGR
jgi:putative ABC transport system permease protein